jgi:hypothetical protein
MTNGAAGTAADTALVAAVDGAAAATDCCVAAEAEAAVVVELLSVEFILPDVSCLIVGVWSGAVLSD